MSLLRSSTNDLLLENHWQANIPTYLSQLFNKLWETQETNHKGGEDYGLNKISARIRQIPSNDETNFSEQTSHFVHITLLFNALCTFTTQ